MRKVLFFLLVLLLTGISFNVFGQEEVEKKPLPGVPVEKGGALIPQGRFVLEPSIQYSHYSQDRLSISGFTVFQAILIGRIEATRVKRDILAPSLTARFGFKDLELSLKAPWLFRRDQTLERVQEGEKEVIVKDNGFGDVEGNIYFHLIREKRTIPDVILNLGVKAPTGRDPYGLKTGVVEEGTISRPIEFPTSSGHWGASTGVTFIKASDPAVLSLNLNYFRNFSRDVGVEGGIDFGEIDPGDSFEYALGSVFALNEKTSMSFTYNQRFSEKTKQNGEKLENTNINSAAFNVGLTYAISSRLAIDTVIGIGLTDDAPDVTVQFRFPFTTRF